MFLEDAKLVGFFGFAFILRCGYEIDCVIAFGSILTTFAHKLWERSTIYLLYFRTIFYNLSPMTFGWKKYAIRIGLGLLVVLAFILHASHVVDYGYLDRMELLSYDLRLNLTLPHSHESRILIVDIDEKSLAEDGRWPWSRDKLALLVDNLFRRQAAVVGFDVVFAEKDESSGLQVLERLGEKICKAMLATILP